MKRQQQVLMDENLSQQLKTKAAADGLSISTVVSALVAKYVAGDIELDKQPTGRKTPAYCRGKYLGSFATLEEVEAAKRDFTRRTIHVYLVDTDEGLRLLVDPLMVPAFAIVNHKMDVFAHYGARLREWHVLRDNITPNASGEARQQIVELVFAQISKGCDHSVVVA